MEENQTPAPTIMQVSLKYGIIMAVVGIVFFVGKVAMGSNPFDRDWTGWLSIAITVGIMVMAHNSFKNEGDGYMTYGQGFGIGTLSMLISGVISMLFSLLYITFIDTGMMDNFYAIQEENMRAQGQNDAAIEVAMEWTKKLFWVFYAIGLVFFSVVCALIVTIFTQKKRPEAI